MPLYEYRCRDCGHEVEVLQKLSDRPLTRCEKCRGRLEKLISRTAFHLKGGGWFDEGYRKSDSSSGSDEGSSGKAESEESTPVESTTESTGEAKKKGESKSESSSPKPGKTKKGAPPKAGKAGG